MWCDAGTAPTAAASRSVTSAASRARARENHLRRNARLRDSRPVGPLRGFPLQPLNRDRRRPMAGRCQALRHRAALHLPGLRPEGCGCRAKLPLGKRGRAGPRFRYRPDASMPWRRLSGHRRNRSSPAQPTTKTLRHTLAPGVAWPNMTPFLIGVRWESSARAARFRFCCRPVRRCKDATAVDREPSAKPTLQRSRLRGLRKSLLHTSLLHTIGVDAVSMAGSPQVRGPDFGACIACIVHAVCGIRGVRGIR
jgi:hypothetical protein